MEDNIYLVVESIDLLTLQEAQELPFNIRTIHRYWWLQSPSTLNRITFVFSDGVVFDSGGVIDADRGTARPALYIEGLDSLNLSLYTELEIFGEEWIYIGNNKALAKDYLWEGIFDEESNDYKTSEIKQRLDDWLEIQKNKFDEN